ncbi:hypothetical protein BDQ12DRAFT_735745 [Crucibulum laeve]|uniref:Uncharacterized protein n=1 Tax=Crucibulum laeve TaxID=68775 RepID=A0A5C3LYY8_9AGAR|nr:hypothetical protein BDQ12DRAFT_735745 [Crucibulum laeve]
MTEPAAHHPILQSREVQNSPDLNSRITILRELQHELEAYIHRNEVSRFIAMAQDECNYWIRWNILMTANAALAAGLRFEFNRALKSTGRCDTSRAPESVPCTVANMAVALYCASAALLILAIICHRRFSRLLKQLEQDSSKEKIAKIRAGMNAVFYSIWVAYGLYYVGFLLRWATDNIDIYWIAFAAVCLGTLFFLFSSVKFGYRFYSS